MSRDGFGISGRDRPDAPPWFGEPGASDDSGGAAAPAPTELAWLDAPGPEGADPVRLRAAFWRAPHGPASEVAPGDAPGRDRGARGLVLLFPGRTEYLEKYARVAACLLARGFSVAALDWRGQGLSTRAVPGLGHVDAFDVFQRDAAALRDWASGLQPGGPRLLLSHSMGGAIALRALWTGALSSEATRPAAAIFSAPMLGLRMPPLAAVAAEATARLMRALGQGRRGAGTGGAETYVLETAFEGNLLTADRPAWDRMVAIARAHPELTLLSPTFAWVAEALAETRALREARVATPRLFLLGDEEGIVSPEAIRDHVARAQGLGEDACLAPIPQAHHEPLMDDPDGPVGGAVWRAIDDFLREQGL